MTLPSTFCGGELRIRHAGREVSRRHLHGAIDRHELDMTHATAFYRALTDALAAGGDEAKLAFEAMMPMKKIDIAAIEAARRGSHAASRL